MKLYAVVLAALVAVVPLATEASSGATLDNTHYYKGHHYKYHHRGHYYNYRWHDSYYRYRWHGHYYNHRYKCDRYGWCYR